MSDCIFCKIINKEIPTEIVFEDEQTIVFKDIHPQAPTHLLIVPKNHLESIKSDGSEQVASQLIAAAKTIAKQKGLDGYKLSFNVGKEGGQIVDHLHLHLLSNQLCH